MFNLYNLDLIVLRCVGLLPAMCFIILCSILYLRYHLNWHEFKVSEYKVGEYQDGVGKVRFKFMVSS